MVELDAIPGRTCIINNKEFLFFSGYSYLGLGHVTEFTDLVKEGIGKYGTVFPSSRISNTTLKLYYEFEDDLSLLTGMESTVIFSSGLLAGKTIFSVLSVFKNIYTAPGTHPAINFENHNHGNDITFHQWSKNITDLINSSDQNDFVIACDSINVLTSEINDLSFIKNISQAKKVTVLIDDSHGIGIIGNNGEGMVSRLHKQKNIEYIISYSLSKAFNITGGAVSCSKFWAQTLRQHANYTASTSINPSLIYACLNAKDLYAKQRETLFRNINYMKSAALRPSVLRGNFDLPVFICNLKDAEEYFYNNGIILSSFRYPYPSSEKINRVIISALHTTEDIDKLVSLL